MLSLVKCLPDQREQILDFLREIVEKSFEIDLKCIKLNWLNKCMVDSYRNLTESLWRPSQCRLLCVEPIVSGLVEFMFDLLDHKGVRTSKETLPITLKDSMTKYAAEIIREIFRVCLII